ncbi:MAG: pyruvate ferredoxin oxidoreductase [Elusimicrobiota bacterium]
MAFKVITANQAAAWGAYLAKSQVVAAYPITPQTSIIETLAGLMQQADWKYKFMTVESEHSVMAAIIAASLTGARAFTATSSQGLLLMHELLHWAAAGRLPIVMVNVNRAIAPGWNIWTDQQDSLSQRDTGWVQIYCADAQEVLDCVIMGYRLAETIQVPVMIVLDAFYLSHTAETVDIPTMKAVSAFLPERWPAFKIQPGDRRSFGEFLRGIQYQRMRQKLSEAVDSAEIHLDRINEEWRGCFGRSYRAIETYRTEGADIVLVASATPSKTARVAVDSLRAEGWRVGLARVRLFRPFPAEALRQALQGVPKVAVLDRNCSWGSGGIFFQELRSALYPLENLLKPKIYSYVYGLGGADITPRVIEEIFRRTSEENDAPAQSRWLEEISPVSPRPKEPAR